MQQTYSINNMVGSLLYSPGTYGPYLLNWLFAFLIWRYWIGCQTFNRNHHFHTSLNMLQHGTKQLDQSDLKDILTIDKQKGKWPLIKENSSCK